MHLRVVQRILGMLLMLYSVTMMPPIAVSVYYADAQAPSFIEAFAITFIAGLIAWFPARNDKRELRLRDGFLVAAVFWLGLGSFGAVPLLLAQSPDMSVTDAIFETVSGLTTTGATVLTGLDNLPQSILYYRAQLHWLGGMGIIVLAVAILPMLGVGGMQLYRAETPGPDEGQQAHAPHHRDGEGPLADLRGADRGLHARLLVRRHEHVRCDLPQLRHAGDRRLLDPRRQHRLVPEPADRGHRDRVHVPGGRQLFPALRCLAQPESAFLPARPGVPGLLPDPAGADADWYRLPDAHRPLRRPWANPAGMRRSTSSPS